MGHQQLSLGRGTAMHSALSGILQAGFIVKVHATRSHSGWLETIGRSVEVWKGCVISSKELTFNLVCGIICDWWKSFIDARSIVARLRNEQCQEGKPLLWSFDCKVVNDWNLF